MAFSEETFRLLNKHGEAMYGIVHHPAQANGALVIMFNIGLHYRVCHSRLFVRQARELQQAGFMVVRMDTSRVGYSHGEIPACRAIDTFDSIQTGLFTEDALLAIDHFRQRFQPRQVFFTGLCGGALTAIIAGAACDNIDGIVFIAGPVTVTSAAEELSTMHPLTAELNLIGYARRILHPEAWLRFVTGKTSYSSLFTSLKVKLKDKIKSKRNRSVEDLVNPETTGEDGVIFNLTFYKCFDNLVKAGTHILFLMPEIDRATWEFDRLFAEVIDSQYHEYANQVSTVRVARATHVFSSAESSRQLFDITTEWLQNRLGG